MQAPILRVLVVDDSDLVRRGIRQILESQPDIEIIGEASDGAVAIRKVREYKPDVVLLDITMPVMNGFEVARVIKHEISVDADSHREPIRVCPICEGGNRSWCERICGEEQCGRRTDSSVAKDHFSTGANLTAQNVCLTTSYRNVHCVRTLHASLGCEPLAG